ncbi:MAG: DUF5107 domain-containing protein [Phycisphaerae bacterium]|nr:DUF5107 domain-containing protein [Phycisphaerae bacterium]
MRVSLLALIVCLSGLIPASGLASVKVWEQEEVIPTYLAGDPEPNPMFYFGRGSQGAQGRTYPYPLFDTLTGEKVDKTYTLVYLENEYLKIAIAPEMGGRIFSGLDKTNGYNFFYKQHVIKPALIGLIGAWISGGVEWNIPHHHRATTFMPVQHRIEKGPNGSQTVWVGELEVRHRMQWAVGYTLHPGRSYLELSLRIVNRTPEHNTMLCFANAAVHTNENYQVIFPPSTQFGTHHHKREFTTWPISTGRYGGGDFSDGVDISWYKNHISANSVFAWNYSEDFLAGYDHGVEAGTLSIANHHIIPGKKFWTWGNGPNGRMWDKILTDEDGPYIELMVGSYSDNQPDYSWLGPYEAKIFKQYWYPFRNIGGVKNANLDAAVNLEITDGVAKAGFCTTAVHKRASVQITVDGETVATKDISINPGKPVSLSVTLPEGTDKHTVRAALSVQGRELVAYCPIQQEDTPMPETVSNPPEPDAIKTNEELYLTGLRLEQFHSADRAPEPYWNEALRRDPGDSRVNTALGIKAYKQARYDQAEAYLRMALERLTDKYTTPRDAEAQYYLGMVLKAQNRIDAAYDTLYKATWNSAWRGPSYYGLAEIACIRGDLDTALDHVERSIEFNSVNLRAQNLKAAVLRHLGRSKEALALLTTTVYHINPLDTRALAEQWLAGKTRKQARVLSDTLNAFPATAQQCAAEYLNAGLWQDGTKVLQLMVNSAPDKTRINPMVYYYLACFADQLGQSDQAVEYAHLAQAMSPDYCFPFQGETIAILERVMTLNPRDARAPYYLGNVLYDWQPKKATALWEKSIALDPSYAIAHRNLAIAYAHEETSDALPRAITSLEQAVALPHKYAIHFAELDELYEAAGVTPEKRLAVMEKSQNTVIQRDDATQRLIALKVLGKKCTEAIALMTGREFEIWEGGSLTVVNDWVSAHLLRGQTALQARKYQEALDEFALAPKIPNNLPSAGGTQRNAEIAYWTGMAHETLGHIDQAKALWTEAVTPQEESSRPGRGRRNRANAEAYFQALIHQKLGQAGQAKSLFEQLLETAQSQLKDGDTVNPSAPYQDQRSQRDRLANAHTLAGLAYLGLSDTAKGKESLGKALEIQPGLLLAKTTLEELTISPR